MTCILGRRQGQVNTQPWQAVLFALLIGLHSRLEKSIGRAANHFSTLVIDLACGEKRWTSAMGIGL